MELQEAGQRKKRLYGWRVEQKEVVQEGAGVEAQEEVLEAVQDAVEEVQGEVLQEVRLVVADQLQEELVHPCWSPVLEESG